MSYMSFPDNPWGFRLVAGLLLCLWAAAVPAKVYQYVGEDGRIHYSDEPPAEAGLNSREVVLDDEARMLPLSVPALAPTAWGQTWHSRTVLVAMPEVDLSGRVGRAWFGQDCVRPRALDWQEDAAFFKSALTQMDRLHRDMAEAWRKLGYRAQPADVQQQALAYRQNGKALLWRTRLIGMDLQFCWGKIRDGLRQYDLEDQRVSQVSRRQAQVTLAWQLFDDSDALVDSGEIRGYADGEAISTGSSQLQRVIRDAVTDAAHRWLADERLAAHLYAPKPVFPVMTPEPAPQSAFSLQSQILIWVIVVIIGLSVLRQMFGGRR